MKKGMICTNNDLLLDFVDSLLFFSNPFILVSKWQEGMCVFSLSLKGIPSDQGK
jgi:hypothetical protein